MITLGIIGVVAALTIPTLIANTRSSQYRSAFKKSISTLSQAARLSDSLYGFDYAGLTDQCGTNASEEHPDSVMSVCALFNGTLTGLTYYSNASDIVMRKDGNNIQYTIFPDNSISGGGGTRGLSRFRAYILSDGTIVGLYKDMGKAPCELPVANSIKDSYSGGIMASCFGFIDVNGIALPNREVSCTTGSNSLEQNTCVVKNNAQNMTDIYPVRFHDSIVEPATAAARYVLRTAK